MEQSISEIQLGTKIIATIGPSCNDYEKISQLVVAGARIFRLNFSHGTHEYHEKMIKLIKRFNRKMGYNLAILVDTKGPEIRTADLSAPIQLKKDEIITLTIEYVDYEKSGKIQVSYDTFINDVEVGEKILVDNGVMNLLVQEKTNTDVICKVLDGGILGSRRHLNLPGKNVSLDSITPKDWEDIDFAIAQGIDYIALSFVRVKEDIEIIREYLIKNQSNASIIAKIESFESTKNLKSLCKVSDAVMVARGDLGAEVPFEEVPRIQRKIIEYCNYYRTPVIVATHMLESMIENPIPTRAETSDVSTAVWQRVDAIMLSGETAGGLWPVKCVETMQTIIKTTEAHLREIKSHLVLEVKNQRENIVDATMSCIKNDSAIQAIFVITRSGHMAKLTSSLRPAIPIVAFTNEPPARRKTQLFFGVTAYRIDFSSNPQTTIQRAEQHFVQHFPSWKGTSYILISDFLVENEFIPTLQIRTL